MTDLHCVCRQGLNHKHVGGPIFESGNWCITDKAADEIVGGRLYLHERQGQRSWHGGTVVSWRAYDPLRKVFTYRAEGEIRVLCSVRWGQELAFVR